MCCEVVDSTYICIAGSWTKEGTNVLQHWKKMRPLAQRVLWGCGNAWDPARASLTTYAPSFYPHLLYIHIYTHPLTPHHHVHNHLFFWAIIHQGRAGRGPVMFQIGKLASSGAQRPLAQASKYNKKYLDDSPNKSVLWNFHPLAATSSQKRRTKQLKKKQTEVTSQIHAWPCHAC